MATNKNTPGASITSQILTHPRSPRYAVLETMRNQVPTPSGQPRHTPDTRYNVQFRKGRVLAVWMECGAADHKANV